MRVNRVRTMKMTSAVISALLFTSIFFALASTGVTAQSSVPNPDTLVYATAGWTNTLDPAWNYDAFGWMILSNCYDTLIAFDRESTERVVPRLATEVPTGDNEGISDDGLTYRFQIRSGVTFVNGYPLRPEDVEYSLERVMVHDVPNGPAWMLLSFLTGFDSTRDSNGEVIPEVLDAISQSVEVEGGFVVLHLAMPYSPFMQILTQPLCSIVSKQWCMESGDWPGTRTTMEEYNDPESSPLDSATMGSGPFMLESWTPAETTVLVRNDLYWKEPATLEHVVILSINDWTTRLLMFKAGEADICDVPSPFYSELEGVEGIRVHMNLLTWLFRGLNFNFAIPEDSPYIGTGELDGGGIPTDFFRDPDIRKGFAYAFDYDGFINEFYQGEAIQPTSPVLEGLPFHNPDQEKYTFDLDLAEQHFQSAWQGDVWENGFTFTMLYNEGNVRRQAMAETLEAAIESINMKFQIIVEEKTWPEYLIAVFRDRHVPIFDSSWSADYLDPHDLVYPFMHSSGFYASLQSYGDPYVDGLIDEGISETDPVVREEVYFELQRIYHDLILGLPIAQPLTRHYERDWVQGWYHNPVAQLDFYEMWKGYTPQQVIEDIDSTMQDLPDNAFTSNADERKNALSEKLEEVNELIEAGQYQEAIDKLVNDIRSKCDGSLGGNPANDWITDPAVQQELCAMIDALVAYLSTL